MRVFSLRKYAYQLVSPVIGAADQRDIPDVDLINQLLISKTVIG